MTRARNPSGGADTAGERPVPEAIPHDLRALLLEGEAEASRGAYEPVAWQVVLRDDSRSDRARFVSLHESFHADLNDSTAFGTLLHLVAYLVRSGAETRYAALLDDLILACRRTHECFATSLALLVMEASGADGQLLLDAYPAYRHHAAVGEELVRAFRGRWLRYHAVTAATRACMQSSVVARIAAVGLGSFTAADLLRLERPDERLRLLRGRLDPTFWEQVLAGARAAAPDLPGWAEIAAEERGGEPFAAGFEERHDLLSRRTMEAFYASVAAELDAGGAPTLPFDGHVAFVAPLVEQAARLAPAGAARGGLPRPWAGEDRDALMLRSFETERLVLSERRMRARFTPIREVPLERWAALTAGAGRDEHFFLAVRLADRIVEQYEAPDDEAAFLNGLGSRPVVTLRRSGRLPDSGERVVEHFVLDRPEDLDALAGAIAAADAGGERERPLVASLSMAAAGDDEWVASWFPRLRECARVTMLVDLSPARHFDAWLRRDELDVAYNTVNLDVDGRGLTAFAFQPRTGQAPIFLAPATMVVCTALAWYVRDVLPHPERFVEDRRFLIDERWLVEATLGHLVREEPWFDFGAGRGTPEGGDAT